MTANTQWVVVKPNTPVIVGDTAKDYQIGFINAKTYDYNAVFTVVVTKSETAAPTAPLAELGLTETWYVAVPLMILTLVAEKLLPAALSMLVQ